MVLANEEVIKKHGLTPLARIVSYGITGVDPTIMGIGPVTAYQDALRHANLSLSDMALCEVSKVHLSLLQLIQELNQQSTQGIRDLSMFK